MGNANLWNNINFYHAQEIIIIIVPFAGIPVAAHVFSVGQGGRSSCLGEDFWHCGLLDDILDRFDVAPVAAFVCFGKRQRKRLFSPGYLQWFLRYHNLAIHIHLFNLITYMNGVLLHQKQLQKMRRRWKTALKTKTKSASLVKDDAERKRGNRLRARNRFDFHPFPDCDYFHKMDHHYRDKRQEEVCPSSRDIPAAGDIGALQGGHPIHPADRHHHTGKEEEEEDSSVRRSVRTKVTFSFS